MQTDDIRSALIALLSQPVAVASVVLIAGVNAAIWLLVFQRLGLPPALASLLLLPPLTLLVPLYVALARWPGQRLVRVPIRVRRSRGRSTHRIVRKQTLKRRPFNSFHLRGPLRLDQDGLPRVRIPLEPLVFPEDSPAYREEASRYLQ
jgi:hypothetical protein